MIRNGPLSGNYWAFPPHTIFTDSNGNFIICGGTTAASTTCPANHYCYYDGTTYGCCPTQGKGSKILAQEGRAGLGTGSRQVCAQRVIGEDRVQRTPAPCPTNLVHRVVQLSPDGTTTRPQEPARRTRSTDVMAIRITLPTQQDCKDYCRVESCPDGGEV
ncbi:hypothetical protein OSTOST_24881, partial [Ostertagia ostertagi]